MNPKNHYEDWTESDISYIRESAKNGLSTKEIADNLKRTESAVREKAYRENISLNPKDDPFSDIRAFYRNR